MNISLTPKLRALVQEKVRSGRYQSASEVVRDALRLLEDVEEVRHLRLQELRNEIAAGLRDLEKGRSSEFNKGLLDRIKTRGRRKLGRKRG